MKVERIYAVPLAEALEQDELCPLCFLRGRTDADAVEAVLGAAKMEPDVRARTNEEGFCAAHLEALFQSGRRQSLSLLLQSLFWELQKGKEERARRLRGSCYLCARVDTTMKHFFENFILLHKQDAVFAEKSLRRDDYCLPHAAELLAAGERLLSKKEYKEFAARFWAALAGRIDAVSENLDAFCRSMDYRQAAVPLSESAKKAVEEAALFLGGKSL